MKPLHIVAAIISGLFLTVGIGGGLIFLGTNLFGWSLEKMVGFSTFAGLLLLLILIGEKLLEE